MKVYRLLGEDELELMLQRKTSALGSYFPKMNGNTHKYKKREKYIHFFFHREDCEYVRKVQQKTSVSEQNYIAEFNIPLKRIIGHIGKGFYESKHGGYDYDYDVCYELAIPVSIFKPEWLNGYEKVSLKNKIVAEQKQPN